MADSNFIAALIDVSIERISSDEVQKFLPKQGKTSLLLDQLRNKLISLKDFLADAEHKASSTTHPVMDWLDDLKDIIYDAENALDLIALQASRYKSLRKASFKKVWRSFSCIIPSDDSTDSQVMEILKRVDGVLGKASALQLEDGQNRVQGLGVGKLGVPKPRRYVGRDLEIKELADIMKNDDSIRVVLISGVSGVGKTSLAQMLYNDVGLDGVFDMKAWLGFQRDYDHCDVFRGLSEAMFENPWSTDMESVEKKLCGFIRGKKLLLVFDDVCFESFGSWEKLLLPISLGARGTTVIVTTCSDNPSSLTFPPLGYGVHLKPLSDSKCWSIIKKNQEFPLNGNLEAIGREMAKKCKGLPFLAAVLGGVLRSIPQEIREWEAILKSPDILRASYNCLYNAEIKLCFAYCSLFPRNYKFEREKLLLLWMAEGFLISNDTQTTPEELGSAYFNELVSRSFFQCVGGKKEACFVMHNLMHDLAVGIFRGNEIRDLRHFSYVQTKYQDSGKFQTLSNDKLRTFLAIRSIANDYFCYMPRNTVPDVFPKWSCLRVLSLSHYQIFRLPASIENARHLRYLNLSYTRILGLPISICKLYKLETLLLSNCSLLKRLPAELGQMVSLRHLDISNTDSLQEMPLFMGKLNNLQTLSKFVVGEARGSRISELGQLQNLKGSLVISGLENVDSSVKAANIKEKVLLKELVYEWHNVSMGQSRVLDELKPHVNLKRLTIHGFIDTKLPDWIGAPEYHKMVAVTLTDCHSCISLPPLGQLASLKHLSIEGFRRLVEVGDEFYGSNAKSSSFTPFLSLETLKFKEMCSWRKWNLFQGDGGLAFPKLKELCLELCPAVSGDLPTHLPLLKKLEIRYYPDLANSLPQLPSIRNLALQRCGVPDLQIFTDLTQLSCSKMDAPGYITSKTNLLHTSTSLDNLEAKHCNFETLCHAPIWLKSITLTHCRNLELRSQPYMNLRCLCIMRAESLTAFELQHFTKLIYLEISSCHNLKSILLAQDQTLESLNDFSISDCQNLVDLPSNGLLAPNLSYLSIEKCPQVEKIPFCESPQSLLLSLKVSSCKKLISNRRNWQLQNLACLETLEIGGHKLEAEMESFPEDELVLPAASLKRLSIYGFQNLKSLNSEGINALTSLEELKIAGCLKLESLPEDLVLPSSVVAVDFVGTERWRLRCLNEDWPRISHLPRIRVNGRER